MATTYTMSWYELVQQAEQAASEAATQLTKRNELHASNRAESSIASARARKHVQTLSRLIEQLRQATDSGGAGESEVMRRTSQLEGLSTRLAAIQTSMRTQPGAHAWGAINKPADPVETATTRTLNDQELMQQQRAVMQQQDQTLDVIGRGAQNLHTVAVAINEEVGVHTRLLDELDEDIEHVDNRLAGVRAKLVATMRKMDSKCLTTLLFFTSMGTVMFVVWSLKHMFR